MSNCLLCNKRIKYEELKFKLKKGTDSNYMVGFRDSGLEVHNECLMKFLWDREFPNLKLKDMTYSYLSKRESSENEHFWKIGTYKLTKYTQEEVNNKEANHYRKLAKAILSK